MYWDHSLKVEPRKRTMKELSDHGWTVEKYIEISKREEEIRYRAQSRLDPTERMLMWSLCEQWELYSRLVGGIPVQELIRRKLNTIKQKPPRLLQLEPIPIQLTEADWEFLRRFEIPVEGNFIHEN